MASLKSSKKRKKAIRSHQVAALPLRLSEGEWTVCLTTTRTTGRWTVPKGWPMKKHEDFVAAGIEAREEAGLVGNVARKSIGSFSYWKRLPRHFQYIRVNVYILWVTDVLSDWKERGQRAVRWMSIEEAMLLIEEPGLIHLLSKLDVANLKLNEPVD